MTRGHSSRRPIKKAAARPVSMPAVAPAPPFRTVADVVADLQKMPQDLPVVVGCHYDNDNGLTNQFRVVADYVEHMEGEYFMNDSTGRVAVVIA